jgi:hypothetical protein
MTAFVDSTQGNLYVNGSRVGKVRGFSISGEAEPLETTTLDDYVRTYATGRRRYQGSCNLFYYETDQKKVEGSALIGSILKSGNTPSAGKCRLKFEVQNRALEFDAIVTTVETGLSAGGIMMAAINFVVTGQLIDASLGGE